MAKKVIIIGAGVSGLSAGIYSALNGFETEIIEMHSVAGGQCTAWNRKGYRFDYCLHWLVGTAKGPFHEIWKETNVLNENTEIVNPEIHSVSFDRDQNSFFIYANIDKWEQYLIEYAPEDTRVIHKMCDHMRKSAYLEPFSNPPEFRSLWDYIKVVPKMYPLLNVFRKFGKLSGKEYFDQLGLTNPKLKKFLYGMYGDRNFSAMAFIFMLGWYHIKNAGYIKGGSFPLAQRMLERYHEYGGKINFGKRVDKIIVENDRAVGVLLTDGTSIKADYVISGADGYNTIFKMLEGKYVSNQIKNAYSNWDLFAPIVQVSLGIKTKIPHEATIQIYPYEQKIGSQNLKFGLSIMNYDHDHTMAPEGKTTLVIRFESQWEFWESLEGQNYQNEKDQILKDTIAFLETIYPGITHEIEATDVATPKTDVRYTGVWKGAYEGFLPSQNNMLKSIRMTLPKLSRFYMIGQWLYPGGGLPPSAQSGKFAIQLICKEEKKHFMSTK
jgi:phytoene dehydrogenase-like protein